jgi:hypothetical protein
VTSADLVTLGGLGYTGDPAATRNFVTYSGTAPTSPTDGDIWIYTVALPYITRVRIAGAWQDASNLSTGALANLNAVDTAQISANAVTAVFDFAILAGPYTRTNIG